MGIFWRILSLPHNIVMDLNNVMKDIYTLKSASNDIVRIIA